MHCCMIPCIEFIQNWFLRNFAPAFRLKDISFQDHCGVWTMSSDTSPRDAMRNPNYYLCLMPSLLSVLRLNNNFPLNQTFLLSRSKSDLRTRIFALSQRSGYAACGCGRTRNQIRAHGVSFDIHSLFATAQDRQDRIQLSDYLLFEPVLRTSRA